MTAWQRNVSHITDPFIFSPNKLFNERSGWRLLEAPCHPDNWIYSGNNDELNVVVEL